MTKITIAIDGYSSCGKSTVARDLASKLEYVYVDTGAMYRAVTLYCIKKGLIKNNRPDVKKIISELKKIRLSFQYNASRKAFDTYLNRKNVEKEIREMKVSSAVSKISAIKEVREKMTVIQKKMGKDKGVVMEGRDIGTNIFPNAELKIFMTADTEIRAQRRLDELTAKGNRITFDEVKQNLEERDHHDTHRKQNPLVKAKDAIVLDNSELNKEQQLEYIIKLIDDLLLTK
jgi:cytidylate kinase